MSGQLTNEGPSPLTEAFQPSALALSFKDMFESFIDPVMTADLDRRITYVNAAFERTFGFRADEVLGQPTGCVYAYPERFEEFGRMIREQSAKGAFRGQNDYRCKNGATFVGETTISSLKDAAGAAVGFIAVIRDVTEQVALQRRFAHQAEFIQRVIQNIPAGICYIDRHLTYRWVNPSFLALLDVTPERLLGRTVREAFPEMADQIEPLLRGVFETGEPHHGQSFPFVFDTHGRKKHTYWDFTYQPFVGEEGRQDGALVLAIEVSERVEKERADQSRLEALQQADRMKDEFLSVVSHELRTPLNFIQGFASILDDEVAGPLTPDQHRYVQRILTGSDTLTAIVSDLLDLSRLKAGKLPLTLAPLNVAALIRETATTMHAEGQFSQCEVFVDVPLDLPLMADREALVRIIRNFVGNALKHAAPRTLRLHARPEGTGVRIEVSDDGRGIPLEHQAKIFDAFLQLDMSNTRKAGGVGLGLSICRALIEAHGGELGVDSEPGRGATFWVQLPVTSRV
ncbi:Alkaline phosphatase synthesis sensor protein PhoR [compost metagenome]